MLEQLPQQPPSPEQNMPPMEMSPEEQDMEQDGGIQEIISQLDSLPDSDKAFVAEFLTPDFAQLMGLFFGDAYEQVFNQLADPSKMLVAVPIDQGQSTNMEVTPPQENPALSTTPNEQATPANSPDPSIPPM